MYNKCKYAPGRIIISNCLCIAEGFQNIVCLQDLLLDPGRNICCYPTQTNILMGEIIMSINTPIKVQFEYK